MLPNCAKHRIFSSCYIFFSDFMRQFNEQQNILEIRTQNKIFFVNDLQEFFKRRAEYDLDYSQKLDRLCDRFSERISKQRSYYGLHKYQFIFCNQVDKYQFRFNKKLIKQFLGYSFRNLFVTLNRYLSSEKYVLFSQYRSCHWKCSVKKDVLKHLAKFSGKHLCCSLFFQ